MALVTIIKRAKARLWGTNIGLGSWMLGPLIVTARAGVKDKPRGQSATLVWTQGPIGRLRRFCLRAGSDIIRASLQGPKDVQPVFHCGRGKRKRGSHHVSRRIS